MGKVDHLQSKASTRGGGFFFCTRAEGLIHSLWVALDSSQPKKLGNRELPEVAPPLLAQARELRHSSTHLLCVLSPSDHKGWQEHLVAGQPSTAQTYRRAGRASSLHNKASGFSWPGNLRQGSAQVKTINKELNQALCSFSHCNQAGKLICSPSHY